MRRNSAVERDVAAPWQGAPLAVPDAAEAVGEVVDENMAAAARAHAAEWGRDMSGRTLIAFGGAAPIHAARIAEKLALEAVLVPPAAGVGSAMGFLAAPVAFEVVRSRHMRLSEFQPAVAADVMADMRAEAHAVVGAVVAGELEETRRAYMRYLGQGFEIAVDVPESLAASSLREAFDTAYEALYGRLIDGLDVEVLSWTLTLRAPTPSLSFAMRSAFPSARSEAGGHPVRVERETLTSGDRLTGPCTVVEDQTVTVVPAGFTAHVDAVGNIVLRAGARRTRRADHSLGERAMSELRNQLVWSRLLAIVEEQAQTLMRTAFSTVVREAGDLSAGVFATDGAMLAQAVTGTPGHVNAMAASVGKFLAAYPLRELAPGDVLVTNDPWHGTGHLNDFTVVTPVFADERPVGLFAATSHIAGRGRARLRP